MSVYDSRYWSLGDQGPMQDTGGPQQSGGADGGVRNPPYEQGPDAPDVPGPGGPGTGVLSDDDPDPNAYASGDGDSNNWSLGDQASYIGNSNAGAGPPRGGVDV